MAIDRYTWLTVYTFGSLFWGRAAARCGLCKAPALTCAHYPRNLEFNRSKIRYYHVVTAGLLAAYLSHNRSALIGPRRAPLNFACISYIG